MGQAVTIGGASNVGKSLIMLNLAWKLSTRIPVVLLDFENGSVRTAARLLALAGFKFANEDVPIMEGHGAAIARARLAHRGALYLVDPDAVRGAPDLEAICQRVRSKCRAGPAVLIVDSLHKLPPAAGNKRDSVDEWCRCLERLRLKYDVTILVTSEVGRNAKGDDPFKESTEIKYASDVALTVEGNPSRDSGQLVMRKHRDGVCTKIGFRIEYPRVVLAEGEPHGPDRGVDPLAGAQRQVRELLASRPALLREEIKKDAGGQRQRIVSAINAGLETGEFVEDAERRISLAVPFRSAAFPGRASPRSRPAGSLRGPAGTKGGCASGMEVNYLAKRGRSASEASHPGGRASRDEAPLRAVRAPAPRSRLGGVDHE